MIVNPNKETIKNLKNSINELNKNLGNSTSNLNSIIETNKHLKDQVSVLKKEREKLFEIGVGDKILVSFDLQNDKAKESFTVLYEADVIESSMNKLKVSATSFTSDQTWPNQSANKQGIINYLQNKWVNKKSCEVITDTVFNRDNKIEELLK